MLIERSHRSTGSLLLLPPELFLLDAFTTVWPAGVLQGRPQGLRLSVRIELGVVAAFAEVKAQLLAVGGMLEVLPEACVSASIPINITCLVIH